MARSLMRGRACVQCGQSLREIEYRNGAVWSCEAHGVQSWFFDEERSDHVRFPLAEHRVGASPARVAGGLPPGRPPGPRGPTGP